MTPGDARHLLALDAFGLMMIEQPLDDEDLGQHARLQAQLSTPVCLDESIVSAARAEEAFALGACRIVNIKPGRLGGFSQSIAVHDACRAHGVPVWHGGMLETGIGRAANVHLASLPNFTLPCDIAASRRYFVPDLVEPPIDVSPRGTIAVPTSPGLGVSVDEDRVAAATRRAREPDRMSPNVRLPVALALLVSACLRDRATARAAAAADLHLRAEARVDPVPRGRARPARPPAAVRRRRRPSRLPRSGRAPVARAAPRVPGPA